MYLFKSNNGLFGDVFLILMLPYKIKYCFSIIHLLQAAKHTQLPSLNTQSCIKGLLGVWDFCLWAVWVAGPVLKKKIWFDYEQPLSSVSSFFQGQKMLFFLTPKIWKNRPQKLLIIMKENSFQIKWYLSGFSSIVFLDPTFFTVLSRLPKRPKDRNPIPQKAP